MITDEWAAAASGNCMITALWPATASLSCMIAAVVPTPVRDHARRVGAHLRTRRDHAIPGRRGQRLGGDQAPPAGAVRARFGLSRRSRRVFAIFAGYRGGVAAETGLRDRIARARAGRPATGGRVRRVVAVLGGLALSTTRICLRYRVTGLAAEAGFFALLSLPPLVLGLVGSIGLLPLVLIGPTLLSRFFDHLDWGFLASVGWTGTLYWTIVPVLAITGLASLYHIATPVRSPWVRDLPGAALALVIWILS